MACKAAAQLHLLDLAGCPVAQRIDEDDIVGHPPFGDLAFQVGRNRLRGHGRAGQRHDHEQRPFLPLRMGNADHRSFGHARASHGQVLDVDRTDPLAARLDDVLGAIGEPNGIVVVKDRNVAAVEPAILEQRLIVAVVAADDPGPANHEPTGGFAVARHLVAELVGDFQVDAVERMPLRGLSGDLLPRRELRRPPRWLRRRPAGAGFRHPPDVVYRNAKPFKPFDHAWRGC